MKTSASESPAPVAQAVKVTRDTLNVGLSDGRSIKVPLTWFPRLLNATQEEKDTWWFIGKGRGIHWEDLDEDISVESLLAGRRSSESQASLKRWFERRAVRKTPSNGRTKKYCGSTR